MVGKTENGRVSLFCGASTLEGVFYQSVCVIMGLDSSETWPLVVTLLPGSKTIRGPAAEPRALMCPIHIQSLICLEIRPFFSTKLHPFLNSHLWLFFFFLLLPPLLSFFQKAQLASAFSQSNQITSPASFLSAYDKSTARVWVLGWSPWLTGSYFEY